LDAFWWLGVFTTRFIVSSLLSISMGTSPLSYGDVRMDFKYPIGCSCSQTTSVVGVVSCDCVDGC